MPRSYYFYRLKKSFKFQKIMLDFFYILRIIKHVRVIEDLCNGSTPDSDSVCGGSNPSSSANNKSHPTGWLLLLAEDDRDSNNLNATCRWHVAATSSKTGGYAYFCPYGAEMQTNPSSSKNRNETSRNAVGLVLFR